MSVNSKMTAIADAIRAKTGGTGLLTLDDMAQDIAAIDTSENLDEVLTEQDSIIDQIQAALEGKAAASMETCSVTASCNESGAIYWIDTTGTAQSASLAWGASTVFSVYKDSMVFLTGSLGGSVSGDADIIYQVGTFSYVCIHVYGDCTINLGGDAGPV